MERININENNINMIIEITDEKDVRLLHFSSLEFDESSIVNDYEKSGFRLFELQISGLDRPEERHGTKYTVTAPGYKMKYVSHRDTRNSIGRKLEIETFDNETGAFVTSHYQFFDGISVVQSYNVVENKGKEKFTLEYITSFNLNGIQKEGMLSQDEKMRVAMVHNSWIREVQWKEYTLEHLGLEHCQTGRPMRSSKAIDVTNTGNWSAKEYIPFGAVINKETNSNLFWQIEHNGSWNWEISDQTNHLYVQVSGPTEIQSHWFKNLEVGDKFETVQVGVGVSIGNESSIAEQLTKYRRAIRRENDDNEKLPVIFNDYMNCLWAKPTTEKEIPLIDKAHKLGAEYFVIDAGWYADGFWWDEVGEWLPSLKRFPNGIEEVISYIRSKNMIPGLWLELEVMGINCKLAKVLPDECFFIRHGKRIYDRSRYQLDFRHEKVIELANEVVDRLVNEYGVGYIKMDYNIEPGIGTEINCDSVGDGLLEHERAYINWLKKAFERHPDLIIENCSSGGLRMDYAMLKQCSIQSTSDQEDFKQYATISANSPMGVTMEQSAAWSYPQACHNDEEVVFNMVNSMLMRIHQSGQISDITPERLDLVTEGISYYKTIRNDIKNAYPFWPLGFSKFSDNWVSLGLKVENKSYLAVWRRGGEDTITLNLEHLKGKDVKVKCTYPSYVDCEYKFNKHSGLLVVKLPNSTSARIFELEY